MVATNIFKGIRPDDMLADPSLQIEPGPGVEVETDDDEEDGEDEGQDVEIEEDEDGGATVTFGIEDDENGPVIGHGSNLAEVMDEVDLAKIGTDLAQLIKDDETSREDWEKLIMKGMTLLGLTDEERDEPFEGATAVVLSLLQEAIAQFQSQAYKELLPPGGPVRTQIVGKKTPEKEDQALRVREYMNYQITEVMEEYDPDYDQMLYLLGIWGSMFKKVYYDGELERAASPYVTPKNIIVPYNARDLLTCERVTHVNEVSSNDLRKQQVSKFYRDIELKPTAKQADDLDEATSKLTGVDSTSVIADSFTLWECHCNLDIPGFEDTDENGEPTGIALPYIVTLDSSTFEVLSIRRNYREADPKRRKTQYFVHYKMMPGIGFYGYGMIHMLGNLAKAGTAILRQLIDAGTLANLPGGFKTKGLRVANSDEPIQPGEWRDVDAPNGDIGQALMPLPYKEPSPTLFQLLGFLVGMGEKFIGTTDLGMGNNPNQEMPVGTTLALLERGTRVMSAVHKRLYYAQRQELRLLARVFSDSLPSEYPYEVEGDDPEVKRQDFSKNIDILPVSDPNIYSLTQRVAIAQEQLKMAQMAPQLHNMREAFRRMYAAIGVEQIDAILSPEAEPEPDSPAAEHAKVLAVQGGAPLKAFEEQDHQLHLAAHMGFMQLPIIASMPPVQIALTQHVLEHIHFAAKEMVRQKLSQAQDPQAMMLLQADKDLKSPQLAGAVAKFENDLMGKIFGPQLQQKQPEDPLVALKSRELDISEADKKAKQADADRKFQLAVKEFETETGQKLQIDQVKTAGEVQKLQQGAQQAALQANEADQKAFRESRKLQLEERKLNQADENNQIRRLEAINRINQANKPQPAPKGAK